MRLGGVVLAPRAAFICFYEVQELIQARGGYPPAFETNLQVWRQLWRVLERCHVACCVIDARHPLLHLPPALMYHVNRTLRKPLVVVLNKLDAVESSNALGWAEALESLPGIARVVGALGCIQIASDDPLGLDFQALFMSFHVFSMGFGRDFLGRGYSKEDLRGRDFGTLRVGRDALIAASHAAYQEHCATAAPKASGFIASESFTGALQGLVELGLP